MRTPTAVAAIVATALVMSGCATTPESRLADIDPVALDGRPFEVMSSGSSSDPTQDLHAELFSVDPDSGDVEWSRDVPWTADPDVRLADGLALLGGGSDVVAVDAASGAPRWQIGDLPGNRLIQTADGVYLTVTIGGIAGLVTRIDPATGRPTWSFVPDAEMSSQVVSDGQRLYLIDGGDVGALDAITGNTVWRASTDRAVTPPILVGGVIVQRVFPDRVVGLDPDSGDVSWSTVLGPSVLDTLTLSGGVVVAVTGDAVAALAPVDGEELWRIPLTDQVVTVHEDEVLIHHGSTIDLVDPVTGSVSHSLEGSGTPGAAFPGRGVVADQIEGSWRLRPLDGTWTADLGPAHRLALTTLAGRLLVTLDRAVDDITSESQGALIAFDPTTGTETWRIETPDGIGSTPVLFGDKLLVLAADRRLG